MEFFFYIFTLNFFLYEKKKIQTIKHSLYICTLSSRMCLIANPIFFLVHYSRHTHSNLHPYHSNVHHPPKKNNIRNYIYTIQSFYILPSEKNLFQSNDQIASEIYSLNVRCSDWILFFKCGIFIRTVAVFSIKSVYSASVRRRRQRRILCQYHEIRNF